MLALSRRTGESIIIGENIEVTVLSITKDQIKLGINAPKNIPIHRKEVYIQIQQENKAAIDTDNNVTNILNDILK